MRRPIPQIPIIPRDFSDSDDNDFVPPRRVSQRPVPMRRSKSPMRRPQRSDSVPKPRPPMRRLSSDSSSDDDFVPPNRMYNPNDPTLWRRYMNGELPDFDDSSDDEDYVPPKRLKSPMGPSPMKTRSQRRTDQGMPPPRRNIPPQFR